MQCTHPKAFRSVVLDCGARVRGGAIVAVVGFLSAVSGCAGLEPQEAPASAVQTTALDAQSDYGIVIEGLRLTSAGSMLDFRYRVLDPVRAAPLLNGKVQLYLLDELRGAKLGVPDTPVLGRIRQTARNNKIIENRTYFVMFGNPGKAARSGDRLTLLLGEAKVTDLTVQ